MKNIFIFFLILTSLSAKSQTHSYMFVRSISFNLDSGEFTRGKNVSLMDSKIVIDDINKEIHFNYIFNGVDNKLSLKIIDQEYYDTYNIYRCKGIKTPSLNDISVIVLKDGLNARILTNCSNSGNCPKGMELLNGTIDDYN